MCTNIGGLSNKFGQVTTKLLDLYSLFLSQVVFSSEEQAAVQSALEQHLGVEYISQRSGAGGQKVSLLLP